MKTYSLYIHHEQLTFFLPQASLSSLPTDNISVYPSVLFLYVSINVTVYKIVFLFWLAGDWLVWYFCFQYALEIFPVSRYLSIDAYFNVCIIFKYKHSCYYVTIINKAEVNFLVHTCIPKCMFRINAYELNCWIFGGVMGETQEAMEVPEATDLKPYDLFLPKYF